MPMTREALKNRLMTEFNSAGILHTLDTANSRFEELPVFFDVAHLFMRVVLNDPGVLAQANQLATKLKLDLVHKGIEVDYVVRAKS